MENTKKKEKKTTTTTRKIDSLHFTSFLNHSFLNFHARAVILFWITPPMVRCPKEKDI